MSKNVTIKVTKLGTLQGPFEIIANSNVIVATGVLKQTLINGITYIVDDNITTITIKSLGKCPAEKTFSIGEIDKIEYATAKYVENKTSCMWSHLTDPTLYNSFYGFTEPYIIEYPFSYNYQDEILQSVIDYTKVFKYTKDSINVFNNVSKIETNNIWFNKAVLYNGQQSSGILTLQPKPINNLKLYLSYPIFNNDSKTILYTKSDNFYQYNTFWSIVKNKENPLFIKSCENMSIDKVVNQDNMEYGKKSFNKETLRAKDLKIRHILDDRSDVNLVSKFIVTHSQISYK